MFVLEAAKPIRPMMTQSRRAKRHRDEIQSIVDSPAPALRHVVVAPVSLRAGPDVISVAAVTGKNARTCRPHGGQAPGPGVLLPPTGGTRR